ncbi:MAG TPA: 4Fe-4S dicluster domain-containing protein [Ktedonobacterales bacterium]|nr:4Fe-4S dicluster domain-containing protein [Ktedonobacterales bacterium]
MATGFFTDTTLCIGCKACEVACKEWNQLPADGFELTGMSYDNTETLSATTWRHVAFIEQFGSGGARPDGRVNGHAPTTRAGAAAVSQSVLQGPRLVDSTTGNFLGENRWLMMSDVCKHCTHAGCLNACPTGAIIRNEFGDVYVQPDICNGCGYCIPSCPFGVIDLLQEDGRAWKCTLCYDRQKDGMIPACAKACPTQSILFGELDDLKERARERVGMLHQRGVTDAYLYGADENTSVGNLNAFFLLVDKPEVYNLPENPHVPQAQVIPAYVATALSAIVLSAVTALAFVMGGRRA